MADVMKLAMVLSATDKMSRVIDQAVNKSTGKLSKFQAGANKMGSNMQKFGAKMTAAGGAITGVLFADVQSIANKAKEIQFASQKIGMSTGEYQKLGYAASKSGLEMTQFEGGVAKLNKAMVLAAMGNKAAAKAFWYAGVSVKDANGNIKSSGQIIKDLSDKFKSAPDGPKKTALAMMLFGKSGKDMIPMLNKGGKSIEEMGKKFQESGNFIEKDGIESFKRYRAAIGENKLAIDGMKTQIAVAVLPTAIKLAEVIASITKRFTGWISRNKTLFTAIVSTVGVIGSAIGILGTFTMVAGTLIRSVNMIIKVFKAVKFAAFAVKFAIFEMNIAQKAVAVSSNVAAAAQWLWNGAMAAAAAPIGVIIAAFIALTSIVMSFIRNWDMITKAFKDKGILAGINAIGNTLLDAILYPVEKILELISKIPGIGKFVSPAVNFIHGIRQKIGVVPDDNSTKKSTALTKKLGATYESKLKVEKAAQSAKDGKAPAISKSEQLFTQSRVNTTKNISTKKGLINNKSVINYNPTINVKGGSEEDRIAFGKMLREHKFEFVQFMKEINGNNARVSFG